MERSRGRGSSFVSSADSVSNGKDCSVECIVIQIVQLSGQIGGEHRGLAVTAIKDFLRGGNLHALVIARHTVNQHLNGFVCVGAG